MGYYIDSRGKRFELEDKEDLYLYNRNIIELDLSDITKLEYLNCYDNKLTKLDLSNNINLKELYCDNNKLTSLDLSNNINLIRLDCDTKTNLICTKQFINNKNISIDQI